MFQCVVETIMIRKMWIAFADGVCHMFGVCNDLIPFASLTFFFIWFSVFHSIFGWWWCILPVRFCSVLSRSVRKSMFNLIRRNNTAHAARREGFGNISILLLLLLVVGCWGIGSFFLLTLCNNNAVNRFKYSCNIWCVVCTAPNEFTALWPYQILLHPKKAKK